MDKFDHIKQMVEKLKAQEDKQNLSSNRNDNSQIKAENSQQTDGKKVIEEMPSPLENGSLQKFDELAQYYQLTYRNDDSKMQEGSNQKIILHT